MAPTKRIEATAGRLAGTDRFRPRRGPPGDDALHAGSPSHERPPPGYPAEPMAVRSVGDPLTTQRFQIWRRTGEWRLPKMDVYVSCAPIISATGKRRSSGGGVWIELRAIAPAQGEVRSRQLLPHEPEHQAGAVTQTPLPDRRSPMSSPSTVEEAKIAELSARLSGALLRPGDAGYDEARRLHNGMIDRRPALIARCKGTAEVVDAVNFARTHRLEIAVRGGGHNVAGKAVCDGGLMIDLSLMKGIHVDPVRRAVRAQGGVTWHEFNRETQVHRLATTGGTISSTGIAGLTLGGGLGWLMGKHGLAVDNLLSAEV